MSELKTNIPDNLDCWHKVRDILTAIQEMNHDQRQKLLTGVGIVTLALITAACQAVDTHVPPTISPTKIPLPTQIYRPLPSAVYGKGVLSPTPPHLPTETIIPPPTNTLLLTPTMTETPLPSLTPSSTSTSIPTITPTPTFTSTETATLTPSPTITPLPTHTPTLTPTPTSTVWRIPHIETTPVVSAETKYADDAVIYLSIDKEGRSGGCSGGFVYGLGWVTAAHCVMDKKLTGIEARAVRISQPLSYQDIHINKITAYPDLDIAVLTSDSYPAIPAINVGNPAELKPGKIMRASSYQGSRSRTAPDSFQIIFVGTQKKTIIQSNGQPAEIEELAFLSGIDRNAPGASIRPGFSGDPITDLRTVYAVVSGGYTKSQDSGTFAWATGQFNVDPANLEEIDYGFPLHYLTDKKIQFRVFTKNF